MTHAPVNLLLPMFADALEMLALTRASFHHYDPGPAETAIGLGRSIHKRERELTEQLIAMPGPRRVILISSDSDPATRAAARRAGASGFVPKDELSGIELRELLEQG